MKRIIISLVVIMVFLFSPCLSVFAGDYDVSVKKAKGLWEWGKKHEAINCLETVIKNDFKDKEAYWVLIQYSLELNLRDKAIKAAEPPPVREKYGNEIASLFASEAMELLNNGDRKGAERFYGLAFEINPSIKTSVADNLFKAGKNQPEKYFTLLINLDPEYRGKIADYYNELSNNSTDEATKMDNAKAAAETDPGRYGDKYRVDANALGQKYLALAKENARWVGKEAQTEKFRTLAIKYLGKEKVDKELPEVIEYGAGRIIFRLHANEKTNHWIRSKQGVKTSVEFFSNNSQYQIRYRDGRVFKIYKNEKLPNEDNEDFIIESVADNTTVALRITEI